ncbi:MAG: hypothetical protein ACRCYS_11505 [Beijerinckiaceae bacterium]
MPIYLVTMSGKKRLVKAATSAGARNHVLKGIADVKAIDAEEAIDLSTQGIVLETAGEEPPTSGDNG